MTVILHTPYIVFLSGSLLPVFSVISLKRLSLLSQTTNGMFTWLITIKRKPKRGTFTKKCYHHHYRQSWMRPINTNKQPSTPLHLIHLSPNISIFSSSHRCHNIFKSAPIVAFRRSNNAALTKQHTPQRLFQCGSHYSTCTYISNGLTSYTFHSVHWRNKTDYSPHYLQLKKPYLHDSVQTLSQTIYRRN